MRFAGIQGAKRRGKRWRTTIADPQAHKRPDLVQREFTAQRPDALWVGDFTYLRTQEGRMFLAFLIDVFSRMIVGWQLAAHMRTIWCSTPSGWRSGPDSPAPTSSSSATPTRARKEPQTGRPPRSAGG
jgi:hypothetical protein